MVMTAASRVDRRPQLGIGDQLQWWLLSCCWESGDYSFVFVGGRPKVAKRWEGDFLYGGNRRNHGRYRNSNNCKNLWHTIVSSPILSIQRFKVQPTRARRKGKFR